LTAANVLTLLRLAAVPLFTYLFFLEGLNPGWIALVFVLTGVTDVLDGRLARARNEVTRFGTLADPLADKLMVLVAVFALTARGSVPRWVAVLLAAKELVQIVGAGFFLVSKSKVTPANSAGKLATVLLYIGITGVIMGVSGMLYVLILGVGVSLIAGLGYLLQALEK